RCRAPGARHGARANPIGPAKSTGYKPGRGSCRELAIVVCGEPEVCPAGSGGSCESEARASGRGPATPVYVWGRSHQGRQKRCDQAYGLKAENPEPVSPGMGKKPFGGGNVQFWLLLGLSAVCLAQQDPPAPPPAQTAPSEQNQPAAEDQSP